jgi:hypothetical protein
METKIIYFVHGTTTDNASKLCSGWKEAMLNNLGREQAENLGKVSKERGDKFDVIFTSDLKRAIESSNIAFPNENKITDNRLRECNYGSLDGEHKSLVVYENHIDIPFNEGESLKDVEYIGAHPMAGKEVYGVKNASDNMFINANYIVTPTNKNTKEAIELAVSIGEELNFANISILSPEKHDEMIAFLSQLTHCIAVSLMTCNDSSHLKEYTGDSFRDLTRIASINEDMWSELFLMNKDKLLEQMDLFNLQFNKLRDSIEKEDVSSIKEMMKLSTYRRSFFNKK